MVFGPPLDYIGSGTGAPPLYGGSIAEIHFAFTNAATSTATAFILPPGATIVDIALTVETTFNNTPTLSIGHTGSTTYYLNAGSVLGTAGRVYVTGFDTSKWWTKLPSPETITVTVGGTPNQGAATLSVRYAME